jgi:hypothetical protein
MAFTALAANEGCGQPDQRLVAARVRFDECREVAVKVAESAAGNELADLSHVPCPPPLLCPLAGY